MKHALYIGIVIVLLGMRMDARGQDWTKVLQLTETNGASAFFFNAQEGLIGTGHYLSPTPAQIYYTNDGGATWKLSQFANPNILGQVTDIYFHDRLQGWATIREASETGWSGVYHSTDGGVSWTLLKQAGFPAGIRETSRGVFYTDRDVNPGVMFSSDTGKTWTEVGMTATALGIDFMDDSTGFVTSQASGAPHLSTTDGGKTWQTVATTSEAWTPYGDPFSRSFFLASERDPLKYIAQTTIIQASLPMLTENKIKNYGDSGLAGGIAGSHVCQSVIYVQGREPASYSPDGIIRTEDAGQTWKFVGGPNTINDKRFAVTGRGAVVIAFDDSGGVWRTADGGDGTLSPSVLPYVLITPPRDTTRAMLCDSASISMVLGYRTCDSVVIASVKFLNDTFGELSTPAYDNNLSFFAVARPDTLHVHYHPQVLRSWTAEVQLAVQQSYGYTEDTLIDIPVEAIPSQQSTLVISGTSSHDTIEFDSVSICSDAFETVTMSARGCSDLAVDTLKTSGFPFSLASTFQPFVLSPGNSRSFLIHYTPDSLGHDRGVLYVANSTGLDSVILLGTGYSSATALSLSLNDSIHSLECDSAPFTLVLSNIACKAFTLDSIVTNAPFRVGMLPNLDSVQPGNTISIPLTFTPNIVGYDTGAIHIFISYVGTGKYDTTIPVVALGTIGKAVFSVSKDSLPMGQVPICSAGISDTLEIYSSGCGNVAVSATLDSGGIGDHAGFSLTRVPKPLLFSPDSDVVIIEFHPVHTTGLETVNLILNTSAGTVTIPISAVVNPSAGTVAFKVSPSIQAYTCESEPFSVSIASSLCDSITIDGVTLSGLDSGDFALTDSVPIVIVPNGQAVISGIFTPQDSLVRMASVTFVWHEADGTIRDTTIDISAQGISVPQIQVALGVTSLSADAGQTVAIPLLAKKGSTTNLNAFEFTLLLNSDLLTPLQTNSIGFFGDGNSVITIMRATDGSHIDTAHIQCKRGADGLLSMGEICEVICEAYVSSELSTGIALQNVDFRDASGSSQCLPSEIVQDSSANFVLDRECSDTTLAQFLDASTLVLDGISPNPTTGLIQLTFEVPNGYANNALLEIFNTLGEKIGVQPIVFPAGAVGKEVFVFDLQHVNSDIKDGILYLRIQTPARSLIAKAILLSEPGLR